jgi:hypothetical protein
VKLILLFGRHRRLRHLVVWLMVALVPMHAIAAGVLAALGPLHTHTAPRAVVVLEDFRRVSSAATLVPRHIATALWHVHAGGAERHRHASGDTSMHVVGDDAAAGLDADAAGSGAALAAIVAVPAGGIEWRCDTPDDVRPANAGWVPQTHVCEPVERPPRIA